MKTTMENTEKIYKSFLDEYGSEDAVRKYTTETAGYGISYLLRHDYANVYLNAVHSYLRTNPQRPLRVLEFGCGGGMNIITLISLLAKKGIPVERAYGTDFSDRLVQSAQMEAQNLLSPELSSKLSFHVATNEKLAEDLAASEGKKAADLAGYFDLIIGVNTFRYCHRLKKENDTAADIYRLLRPGGVCVNIDMNNRFPVFRSKLRGTVEDPAEAYVPTLEEYATPFKLAGFELIKKKHFCWIPHSAGRGLTYACLFLSPLFSVFAGSRAMRSLVVARKPA